MRMLTLALATASTLILGGAAIADSSNDMKSDSSMGDTSGPKSGGNVNPSTAVQKNGRSSSEIQQSPAAGAPGVEGPAGSENGPAPSKSK